MPGFIDALIVLPESRPASEVLPPVRAVLSAHGATFPDEAEAIVDDADAEPVTVYSEAEAWNAILAHPRLGGTQYAFAGLLISVFLLGDSQQTDAVSMSAADTRYTLDPQFREAYDRLIEALHRSLHALRTIADHEILSPGSRWSAEVERIRAGLPGNQYATDLRQL
jgi:hypothetical protein